MIFALTPRENICSWLIPEQNMFFIWICMPFHVEFRPESSLCLDCGYFFQSLLRWTSGQIMQVKTVSKFSSGGGRDALACKISGHPFHVSSRKCLETPNLTLFTKRKLRRNLETYLTVSNSAGNQDTSAGQISDFSCRALVRKHLETPNCCPFHPPLVNYGSQFQAIWCFIDLKVHFITMTSQWVGWRLKSPASRLFTQPFIRAQIKENIKAPCHWPLCGEFTGYRWIPRTNGQ